MTDPRFDAARRTDQSGGRGWHFDPSPPAKPAIRPSAFTLALGIIGLGFVAVSMVAGMI